MRIQDCVAVWNLTDPSDIATALGKRHRAGFNTFWLSHGSELFPVVNIMVNGDLAYIHYLPGGDHPGFISVGSLPGLEPGGCTEFVLDDSNERLDLMNEAVVPFSEALRVAQEFAISSALPKCMHWNSLVDGE